MIDGQITNSSSLSESEVGEETLILAQMLSVRHGNVRITKEEGGIHLYMASPICLERYGDEELTKMHLAVNADKYNKHQEDWSAMCMKTDTPFRVSELLSMKTLERRGFVEAQHLIQVKDSTQNLEPDENGILIPKSPGVAVPLISLSEEHHAVRYVKSRGFDLESLDKQFRMGYCFQERDDMYYRYLGHGFRATSQERIIFYVDVNGVQRGWQARILDFVDGDGIRYYFHPYKRQWVPIESKVGDKWEELDPDPAYKWNPARYIIAHGAKRNHYLMGYDAAVDYNEQRSPKVLGLTEGPFDAARLGIPFCAVMGKHFSERQAKLCVGFDVIILAMQNDEASEKLKDKVESQGYIYGLNVITVRPPDEYKDFGEMSTDAAANHLKEELKDHAFDYS